MTEKEFLENTRKCIDELSAGLKYISIDYFNYNEVNMEITKRLKGLEDEK